MFLKMHLASLYRGFGCTEKLIPLQLHKVGQLLKASCVLHNWLRQSTTSTFPGVTDGMLDVENW